MASNLLKPRVSRQRKRTDFMAWHFYQGVRDEWRWYRVDSCGGVTQHAERAFPDLAACMTNAEHFGFSPNAFHVHARAAANAPMYSSAHEETSGRTDECVTASVGASAEPSQPC
jgi:hypothetical protein